MQKRLVSRQELVPQHVETYSLGRLTDLQMVVSLSLPPSLGDLPHNIFLKWTRSHDTRIVKLSISQSKLSRSPPLLYAANTLAPGFEAAGGEAPHRCQSRPPPHLPPTLSDAGATVVRFLPMYLYRCLSAGVVDKDKEHVGGRRS